MIAVERWLSSIVVSLRSQRRPTSAAAPASHPTTSSSAGTCSAARLRSATAPSQFVSTTACMKAARSARPTRAIRRVF
jgi:hypothetical protein